MRSRIILFVVLAVVTALVGVYVGRSTNTPKAVGEPATATPADPPVGATQRRGSSSGPARSPTASPPKASPPTAGANPGGTATQPGQKPATNPASPQPSTGPVRFGKVTTTPSGNTILTDLSPDRRAFTLGFSDNGVQVGPAATKPATRSFAITLPLTDGAKGKTLRVYVLGDAFVQESGRAYARLTLKLNGQGTVKYYPSGFNHEIYEVLEAPATPATTYRLSGVIEVQQAPGTNETAYLNVSSIETSIS